MWYGFGVGSEDETPPRPSQTLVVFAKTLSECLRKLDALGLDLEGRKLRHEAANLLTAFDAWSIMTVIDEDDRAQAVQRTIDLDRAIDEYLLRKKNEP